MSHPAPQGGVTFRALGISLALSPAMAYWIVQSEFIWYSGHPTTISLFSNVTFVVFLLALINLWIGKRHPTARLAAGELMTIYIFLCFVSVMCSHDFLQVFIPLVAFPRWEASPENRWDELFFGEDGQSGPVPTWLIVNDLEALRGFYEGHSSMYRWSVLRAWAGPLFWWGTFIIALVMAIALLTTIFRKQWTENERLSYPVIQIPLEIATNLQGLLSNKIFWYGFGIAAGVGIINGINFLEPRIPGIPLIQVFDFKEYLVGPPWDAMGNMGISIHLFAIGMCFFLPTDLIFSCWFFFLFFRFQEIAARMSGIQGGPGFPFVVQQSAGGYLALCILALWISRRHLRKLFRTLLGRPGGLDETGEPLRYRLAVTLFLACTAYLIGFGMAAGADLWVMVVFFGLFYMFCIAIARMRAELGPPAHDLHHSGPGVILTQALGTHGAGQGNLAVFSLFFFFNRAYRAHIAPTTIEGFKIAERLGMSPRRLFLAMVLAMFCGLFVAYWALLHSLYVSGVSGTVPGPAFGGESWRQLSVWLQSPQDSNLPATFAMVIGLLFSLFLAFMRMTFTWWPFHPVGYATSSTWSMQQLWFSMLLAWAIKAVMLRYGGARVYRPAVPFFIGLVLGEFVVGSLWTIYGSIVGRAVYRFWG